MGSAVFIVATNFFMPQPSVYLSIQVVGGDCWRGWYSKLPTQARADELKTRSRLSEEKTIGVFQSKKKLALCAPVPCLFLPPCTHKVDKGKHVED